MAISEVCSLTATQVYKHFCEMRQEILLHKWYESEKAGKDVGFEFALVDWNLKFKNKWDSSKKY